MQHERFLALTLDRINDLGIASGSERRDDNRLCFAAREYRGSVRTRQRANLHIDRANCLLVAASYNFV